MDPLPRINRGENHSCSITGYGYFTHSPKDFTSFKYNTGTNPDHSNFWREGDKIHAEIDMINQRGSVWNDKDKEKKHLFQVQFDATESVAIFVDVGNSDLEITAVHQEFRYKHQN